ncbi:MAG TPA: cyanophycin synthetase [Bacteroidales bacterium]|nr:cyanophycin synthetase [Bacteroidales bacterium]HOR81459.1 cyanophycin synthetase [Bacteroidales bacterium]HPJ90634.1 cyanophycin synthetase [Bacteroidales bacterium]
MNIESLLSQQPTTVGNLAESRLVQVRNKNLQAILNRFDKEEHRLEFVKKYQGVTFINDAKATSINATYHTLGTLKQKAIWIAGGKDDTTNYEELLHFVSDKVEAIVCIGNDNKKIIRQFFPVVSAIYERKTMEEAVFTAFHLAEQNRTVVYSPACECEDKHGDYEKLGTQFKNAIAQL